MYFIDIANASPLTDTEMLSTTSVAAKETIHTAVADTNTSGHVAVEDSVAATLGLNGQMFVFQLINFILVAIVLWFLILKPLTSKMTERQKMIDDSLDNAKKVQENLMRSEKEYQIRIDEAKVEANKIIATAQTDALHLSEEIKNKAKKEIEGLVAQAREKIKDEKNAVLAGIKLETANLIMAATEKIIGEKIDAKKDEKIIAESLKEINYDAQIN